MNKKLKFFVIYMAITTPITLLADFALNDNTLSVKNIIGSLLGTLLVFWAINWISVQQNKTVVRKPGHK